MSLVLTLMCFHSILMRFQREINPLVAPEAASNTHAWTSTQQVNYTMAARGHVQDPNDRRLRPIYGKVSMGTYTFLLVWRFGKHTYALSRGMCWKRRLLESWGSGAAPPGPTTDSAACSAQWQCTLPGFHWAGEEHVSDDGFLNETVCPSLNL